MVHHVPHLPPPVFINDPLDGLAADVPLVMLPVRVETRWFPLPDPTRIELRIRIFPDEIHIAPPLATTETERDLTAAYKADPTPQRYSELERVAGPSRASWLVRALAAGVTPPPDAADDQRLVTVSALPNHWIAIAKAPGVRAVATGSPIASPLVAAPHKNDDNSDPAAYLGKDLAWLTEFSIAEDKGMALRMTLLVADANRLDELIVLGVPGADPATAAASLAELLERHAGGEGAECLPAGTPTNVAGERAPLPTAKPIGATPSGDAKLLLETLGIDPSVACDVVADPVDRGAIARSMNLAMWPATLGYFLEKLAGRSSAEVAAARSLYIEHVRPNGPVPALRVRSQPYGILPATSIARWPASDARGGLAALLGRIAATWDAAVARVPRLVDSTDLDRDLLAVLRRMPTSVGAWVRAVVDSPTASVMIGNAAKVAEVLRQVHLGEAAQLGVPANLPIYDRIFYDRLKRLGIPFVAPSNVRRDAPLPSDYLSAIANANATELKANPGAPTPRTLLYLLAQHASTIARVAVLPPDVLVHGHGHVLERSIPISVWNRLDGLDHVVLVNPDFVEHSAALKALGAATVGELEAAFAAVLDSASYRLDAWSTAIASERLATLRTARPHRSHVSGWAWLEKPRPAAPHAPGGYLLAPSLAQVRTAAVLRAGYEAHRRDDNGATLAIDLSSDRVRSARWLLDGMRDGAPIGRLLGSHIEAFLQAQQSDYNLVELRRSSVGAGEPVPDVADGWALYHTWAAAAPSTLPTLIANAYADVDKLLDATSDLLLADSVHNALAASPARSAASLDALQRGEVATPDPRVDRTMTDGDRVRRRVIVRLAQTAGWPGGPRPRSAASPGLEGLAARVLGSPAAATITIEDAVDGTTTTLTRTLADLDVCALDVVALAASGTDRLLLDLASATVSASAGGVRTVTGSAELDAVVLRAAALARLFRFSRTPTSADVGAADAPVDRTAAIIAAIGAVATRPAGAAVVGPALAGDPTALAAALTSLRALAPDVIAKVVRGDAPVPAPVHDVAGLPQVATTASDVATWLSEMARVRGPLEPLDLLVLVAPDLFPVERRMLDGVELTIFGTGDEALFVDAWSETAPAESITAGVAFPFDAPRAQPPQAILVAVPPPGAMWSLSLAEAIIDETIASARRRVVAPEDVRGQLGPALLVLDDPKELEPQLDLQAVSAQLIVEALQ